MPPTTCRREEKGRKSRLARIMSRGSWQYIVKKEMRGPDNGPERKSKDSHAFCQISCSLFMTCKTTIYGRESSFTKINLFMHLNNTHTVGRWKH